MAAFKAYHPNYDIVYQDINGKRDIGGDMMKVDLDSYDFIIATPPCNFWSRGNYRRTISIYSLHTYSLLPNIILKLIKLGKPFIVENVRNAILFEEFGLFKFPCYIYFIGRHTYWTNVLMPTDIPQIFDDIHHSSSSKRQGGMNVHNVIECWLSYVTSQIDSQI